MANECVFVDYVDLKYRFPFLLLARIPAGVAVPAVEKKRAPVASEPSPRRGAWWRFMLACRPRRSPPATKPRR